MAKLQEAHEAAKPPPKIAIAPFKKRFPHLPRLMDYRDIPESYWDLWPKVEIPKKVEGYINHSVLRSRCLEAGLNPAQVHLVCDRLVNGADIGARGKGRTPLEGKNHSKFYEYGERSMDTVYKWISSKPPLICGPLTEAELNGKGVRVNPLQTALKPNGDARVCVDQSWPRKEKKDQSRPGKVKKVPDELRPLSVNESIDIKDFPTLMISLKDVLLRLLHCLPTYLVSKIDWTGETQD